MKNLSNLIKGLQIIAEMEKENKDIPFNSQDSKLFIGELPIYDENKISELKELGFYPNSEFGCFEYNLD